MATKTNKTLAGVLAGALAIAGGAYLLTTDTYTGTVYNLAPGGDKGIFQGDASGFKPKDTIKLKGQYSYAYFSKLMGDSLNPIVIDGQNQTVLSAGFDFNHCRFFKVINFIVDQKNTNGSAVAISIHGYSDHGEFANFKVMNAGYGIWLKNEHDDLKDTAVSSHVLNYFSFHDFEFTNFFQHGGYLGPTETVNKTRPVTINGVNYYPNPSKLGNVKIYNGKIRRMGKNGMMLCNARVGVSEIYNLDIDTTGLVGTPTAGGQDQGAGIQLGGFTNVKVYNNKVNHSWLWGIRSFGADSLWIENNQVSNSGNNTIYSLNWPQNICIGPDATYSQSGKMFFSIKNNILDKPGVDVSNIQVYKGNCLFSDKNVICGNTGTEKVESGILYSTACTSVPIPPPVIDTVKPAPIDTVSKVIFWRGYKDIAGPWGKRFYYIVYKEAKGFSIVQTNGRYQPL